MRQPACRIHFAKDNVLSPDEITSGVAQWTCAKGSVPGDIALLYFGGKFSELRYIALVRDEPFKEEGDSAWATSSRLYYFTSLHDITRLDSPIGLQAIRQAFPDWKAWSNIHGRITVEVHPSLLNRLATLITKANPDVKRYFSKNLLVPTQAEIKAARKAILKSFLEGQKKERVLELVQRNPRLTIEAKMQRGLDCEICGFNFEKKYGVLGRDFIEVHHLRQLAKLDGEVRKVSVEDVRVVCSNCHSIIHCQKDMLSVQKVKRALRQRGGS